MRQLKEDERIVAEVEALFEKRHVRDAIEYLWTHAEIGSIAQKPALYLIHSRLVGHLGEYSEALRVLDDIRANAAPHSEWARKAAIWSAVYWSRLGEWKRARTLLDTHEPLDKDPEFAVLHWGHRLSIAIDSKDRALAEQTLGQFSSYRNVAALEQKYLKELELWYSLLKPMTERKPALGTVRQLAVALPEMCDQIGKRSFRAHVAHRLAHLWLHCGDKDRAFQSYCDARETALDANSGLAFVLATVDYLDARRRFTPDALKPDQWEQLIGEALIVAGQHGIGLLPCALTGRLWKWLEGIPSKAGKKEQFRTWLYGERFIADLTRLDDGAFELWCKTLLMHHGSDLLGLDQDSFTVEKMPDSYPGIDLLVRNVKTPARLGIQCKGGASIKLWTNNVVRRKLKDIRGQLFHLKKPTELALTEIAFVCTTRVHDSGAARLNDISQEVFGRPALIFDELHLKPKLIQDPALQTLLCLHGSGIWKHDER